MCGTLRTFRDSDSICAVSPFQHAYKSLSCILTTVGSHNCQPADPGGRAV